MGSKPGNAAGSNAAPSANSAAKNRRDNRSNGDPDEILPLSLD